MELQTAPVSTRPKVVRVLTKTEPDWCIFCGLTKPDGIEDCFCSPECEHHYFERNDG